MLSVKEKILLTDTDKVLRYFLPYCIHKISSRKGHVYLPLNREYKPIGVVSKERVDYEAFPHLFVRFARCPSKIKIDWQYKIIGNGGVIEKLYFYNDGLKSRGDYFEKYTTVMDKAKLLIEVR